MIYTGDIFTGMVGGKDLSLSYARKFLQEKQLKTVGTYRDITWYIVHL